jgi:TolB protein
MRAGRRGIGAVAVGVALVAGCTEEPARELPRVDLDSPAAAAPGASSGPGRLAVLDELGNLVTLAPDGSDELLLAEALPGRRVVQQPTWSPDGSRLAWVRVEGGDDGGSVALVTSAADGTGTTEAPTPVAPFYLSWDPTSSRIAYLGSSTTTEIQLGVVDVAGGGGVVSLGTGRPFYLSWNPTGSELLVHVGTDRLERLELDGTLTTVHERPGTFNVPVWTADGRSFVYASGAGERQRLVVHDPGRRRGRGLVRFGGSIVFVVSPDGSRIAFQVIGDGQDVGPLSVVDRETGEVVPVADGAAPAFFWSPAGDRLLYLGLDIAPERVWFRWNVWDGASSFGTPRFVPSQIFGRDYLQFFEQYSQSMRLWSPDGTAFTYAGASETGEQGIWVQAATPDVPPVRVSDGVFAAWSPT